MAGPTIITLPNGDEIEFPEGMTDQEIEAALQSHQAAGGEVPRFNVGTVPPEQRIPEDEGMLKSSARFVGSSLLRGLGTGLASASDLIGLDGSPPAGKVLSPNAQALVDREQQLKSQIADVVAGLVPFELSPRPTSAAGKAADSALQFAAGSAFGPGSKIKNIIAGLSGGAGMEVLGSVAGEESPVWKTVLETLGAVLGAGGAGAAMNSRTLRALGPGNAQDILRETVTPEMEAPLRTAAAQAAEARAAGVPLNTLDPLPGPKSALADIQETLMQIGGGNQLAANVRDQGPGLQALANKVVADLPGNVLPEQSLANNVQDVATARLRAERKKATKNYGTVLDDQKTAQRADAVTDLRQAEGERAAAGEQFARNTKEEIEAAANRSWIRGDLKSPPNSAADTPGKTQNVGETRKISAERLVTAERELLAAQDALEGIEKISPLNRRNTLRQIDEMIAEAKGNDALVKDLTYIRNSLDSLDTSKELHTFIRAVQDNLPSVKELGNANKAIAKDSVVGAALGKLKTLRNETTPAYGVADEAYNSEMEAIKSLKKDTDVGMFAGPRGSAPDRNAAREMVFRLLDKGESPNVRPENSRLSSTLRELGRQDPELLKDLLKTRMDDILTQVFGKGRTGRPTETAGQDLTGLLGDASNPQNDARLHGLRIMLDEVARANKMSVSERLAMQKGIDQLRMIANASARSPGRVTSMGIKELDTLAQDPKKLAVLRMIGIHPGWAILRNLQPRIKRKTFEEIDRLLSDPDQVEALIELGKAKQMTAREASAWAAALGYGYAQLTQYGAAQSETPTE